MATDTWMITARGAEHHLAGVGMAVNRFEIQTIAHALAQINRFTGHAVRPYSVAEHSLLCCALAAREGLSPSVQLACLMHDAHEAFTGDVASPVKWSLQGAWEGFEHVHAVQVRRWYGLQSTFAAHRATIRHFDLVALATERRDLTLWDSDEHEPWAILRSWTRPAPRCGLLQTTCWRVGAIATDPPGGTGLFKPFMRFARRPDHDGPHLPTQHHRHPEAPAGAWPADDRRVRQAEAHRNHRTRRSRGQHGQARHGGPCRHEPAGSVRDHQEGPRGGHSRGQWPGQPGAAHAGGGGAEAGCSPNGASAAGTGLPGVSRVLQGTRAAALRWAAWGDGCLCTAQSDGQDAALPRRTG